jgi:digeranylgeranylglycerophospholipid reductase
VHLDDCIRRAAERAGARVLEDTHVAALRVQDGVVTGVEGPELDWRARIVIAADGHGSVGLAGLEGAVRSPRHLTISATLYCRGVTFPNGPNTADHYFEHDLPCGYAWVFPEVDGVANIGVGLRKDTYERSRSRHGSLAARLEAFVARHPDRFAGITRVGKVRAWALPLAPAPWPASAPGLLFAGDAGNMIDPLIGEGIWQALYSGMAAARIATEALASPSGLTQELRDRFEAELHERIGRPSRAKAVVQEAMRLLLAARLYRLPPVRGLLRLAYTRRSLEMTKV